MTEMTKHMMTAMTIPTYRATSSVLGAAGERQTDRSLEKSDLIGFGDKELNAGEESSLIDGSFIKAVSN